MFPTFISILDIQSWWEVPSIAHFCSLFRTAFNLLDFDIEDLEEALLTDGTEESSWLQELIVRLLSGCLPNNEISTSNYQMFLRRLFRQKCQEHDRYNPFNTDVDFQLLPLRTKVDILYALCDFRLDANDVFDQLKNLEADSLRVEPLGYDDNHSAYWYFYGTRLYREDFKLKNKSSTSVWQVICFTEEDWLQLTKKFKKASSKAEKQLYRTLTGNFLPELPRLFKEKEKLARKRLLERPRKSSRIQKLENLALEEKAKQAESEKFKDKETELKRQEEKLKKIAEKRKAAYERRAKLREQSGDSSPSEQSGERYEMAGAKTRNKNPSKTRTRKGTNSSDVKGDQKKSTANRSTTVGRQTNNSLASATGQIVIQPAPNSHRKKLKTSQVFPQTDEDLQTGMHKILDHIKNHEDAWPFIDPVEEEYAPNYYSIIRKPMDLQKMEERLDAGHYKNFSRFKADFQLIVDNCRLYNGVENEYTEMVYNLVKVFDRAAERYLDQISSSDDEVAVQYLEFETDSGLGAKAKKTSNRKPTLAAQTDKKRERSVSRDSISDSISVDEKLISKAIKTTEVQNNKKDIKKNRRGKKGNKQKVSLKKAINTRKSSHKNSTKNKVAVTVRSPSRGLSEYSSRDNWSTSPPPSWPPSEGSRHSLKDEVDDRISSEDESNFVSRKDEYSGKADKWNDDKHKKGYNSYEENSFLKAEHRDKHNKLRETIEKLKAKSEIGRKLNHKESEYINTKVLRGSKSEDEEDVSSTEQKAVFDIDCNDGNSTADSSRTDSKSCSKKEPNSKSTNTKSVQIEALTLATEQTLKDINKWLDDTPRFSDFSSSSNSPSHCMLFDDLDSYSIKADVDKKKFDKSVASKKDPTKDGKKKSLHRDPAKFLKKREIQRTIDRLQPGKSKGNLLSNIQNSKAEELFPLGTLSKTKDIKSSLIVKPEDDAPKLSLGSVLDTFGKHKFIDDPQKDDFSKDVVGSENIAEKNVAPLEVFKDESNVTEDKPVWVSAENKATPNLSAWFKAFGAPKMQQNQKKCESKDKSEEKPNQSARKDEPKKNSTQEMSPNAESPIMTQGQPAPRQRKISTGSSMSERSSFSQDLDSPRVAMDERLGAYPAPYPSPLHRSPSGASPVMVSPRLDVSPKAPSYPMLNGQIRVGFYQDTVSTKSSPDKSCSPRDNPQSPYNQYPEHGTFTGTTVAGYPYGNLPYSSQLTYSSANSAPSYSESGSTSTCFDTTKPLTDQYQTKTVQNISNESSPPSQQHSPSTDLQKAEKVQQTPVFPVKKRVYSEAEPDQLSHYEQSGFGRNVDQMMERQGSGDSSQSSHSISDSKQGSQFKAGVSRLEEMQHTESSVSQEQHVLRNATYCDSPATPYNRLHGNDPGYLLNIPTTSRQQEAERRVELPVYTNMGYTGVDGAYLRNSPQFVRSDMNYGRSGPPSANVTGQSSDVSSHLDMTMRYGNSNLNLGMSTTASSMQQAQTSIDVSSHTSHTTSDSRLQTFGNPSLEVDQSLRGNLANLSHIVDRFPTDDRMLSGIQPGSAYYSDKGHSASNVYGKTMATSSSGLPIFNQPNVTMPYSHDMQSTASSIYNKQFSDLQSGAAEKNSQTQDKKSKRRRSTKSSASNVAEIPSSSSTSQGFQSYAGIKTNAGMEPGAISLKTASVVPGSAFNFGPASAGLGLSAGLYGDKDGYPNFLEDFRAAPNYYMAAAAAAHHRSVPDASEKSVRTAHQSSTPQGSGYSFLGAPQPRPPGYSLGTPFMPAHQPQLMDTSSPLYQQYMLHQGLLGASSAYSPGYHPALSMRQPYESMTRPSWL